MCFFHPFDDGNARAALLTLVFLAAREGAVLDSVAGLRRIAAPADDPRYAVAFTRGVESSLRRAR